MLNIAVGGLFFAHGSCHDRHFSKRECTDPYLVMVLHFNWKCSIGGFEKALVAADGVVEAIGFDFCFLKRVPRMRDQEKEEKKLKILERSFERLQGGRLNPTTESIPFAVLDRPLVAADGAPGR